MVSKDFRIESDDDLNHLREALREFAADCEFTDYETTKIVTAASEISRNILNYAEVGEVTVEVEEDDPEKLRAIFKDEGPGIEDVERAMEDGYSGDQSNGLGVGLPGAERLADEFKIQSSVGEGTTVTVVIIRDQVQ